ncbi:hypothetical protein [Sphingobacterium spiritivorum]|uniref:hypothetical protein n=1 Tax=Sphingobacterium spiritivorum TaxID=258 RepID=UPI003DA50603
METKLLINQLTAFYPVGIPISDEKRYEESVEYKRKIKAINTALKNRDHWENTKHSIFLHLGLQRISDYSFAGGYATYYASFRAEQGSSLVYSILISVLLPYYCIRISNTETETKRYRPLNESEILIFDKVSSIIISLFKDYELIDDKELLEYQVSNIEFDYADPPTIAHLLFTTIEA